jgi:hypothetical protein
MVFIEESVVSLSQLEKFTCADATFSMEAYLEELNILNEQLQDRHRAETNGSMCIVQVVAVTDYDVVDCSGFSFEFFSKINWSAFPSTVASILAEQYNDIRNNEKDKND